MPTVPASMASRPLPLDLPSAPMATVRLGLIGLGWVTNQCHLPAIRMLRDAGWPVEVTALCDLNPSRLHAVGEEWPAAAATLDPQALMSRPDLDGVLILTHPNSSARLLREALTRTRFVFVEKPVAYSAEEIESCLDMVNRHQVKVQVGYNRRYQPLAKLLGQHLPKAGIAPHWAVRFWRANRREPGFYDDTLVHCLDFLHQHLGALQVTAVRVWPKAAGDAGLDRGWQVELETVQSPRITAAIDIRPAVGRDLEGYTLLGEKFSLDLQYPHLGTTNGQASLTLYENGQELILHQVRMTAEDWFSRCWYSGFLTQMAEFCRLCSGARSEPACDLGSALAVLRLREGIIGHIGRTGIPDAPVANV